MRKTVHIQGKGEVKLTDRNYVAAGGEASVYKHGKSAIKIYHERTKMIPLGKIQELQAIMLPNVLVPKEVVRDSSNRAIGYTMSFVKISTPICRLFTKSFRSQNQISEQDIADLVKEIQTTVAGIHGFKCLVVDLNELNILASSDYKTPLFIDTDSYQTPNFKATAIMASIRDPKVKGDQFTALSDWFSFAVIAFQLYIGIHPYKGRHPSYKANEWQRRMDDGISVFDKDVSLPRVCNDFSVIPARHLDWLKIVFVNNDRCKPPLPGAMIPIAGTALFHTIVADDTFTTKLLDTYPEDIIQVFDVMGVTYAVGMHHIMKDTRPVIDIEHDEKIGVCRSSDMRPVIGRFKNGLIRFVDLGNNEIGRLNARAVMYRNGCAYSIFGDKMTESRFVKLADKVLQSTKLVCTVSDCATHMFDGVVFQDLLGKWHITLPFEVGKCLVKPVKELDGYRVIEARSEENICVVLAEKAGTYSRFILTFDKIFSNYEMRCEEGIGYVAVNFTVKTNGVAVLAEENQVQIFRGGKAKIVKDPPFSPATRLFNVVGDVRFVEGNKIYSVSLNIK